LHFQTGDAPTSANIDDDGNDLEWCVDPGQHEEPDGGRANFSGPKKKSKYPKLGRLEVKIDLTETRGNYVNISLVT